MSIKRRLSHIESRQAALKAAQELLLDQGPQAITLKAVAERIGRTHANLLHHFGSAAGLQKALAEYIVHDICEKIGEALLAERDGPTDRTREVVDQVFEAVGQSGGGALVSWLLLTGNEDALVPVLEEIGKLVIRLQDFSRAAEMTLVMVLLAMGDARLGKVMTEAFNLPRHIIRDSAEYLLRACVEHYREEDNEPEGARRGPNFGDYERARAASHMNRDAKGEG